VREVTCGKTLSNGSVGDLLFCEKTIKRLNILMLVWVWKYNLLSLSGTLKGHLTKLPQLKRSFLLRRKFTGLGQSVLLIDWLSLNTKFCSKFSPLSKTFRPILMIFSCTKRHTDVTMQPWQCSHDVNSRRWHLKG